ncbi:MAG: class I SAM-dependent methyltransferase [Pseudomonadaceae bacterium]|nr:class I SAM-dependent methyltransferase [Pseudomonadaceae bacterium]
MSIQDRERWNARYAEGAYANRDHPSAYLLEHVDLLPRGDALDLACGAGRNSRFLAEQGWQVTAVDISDEGLARVATGEFADRITTRQADLDQSYEPAKAYDVVLVLRYLNLNLIRAASGWLKPGGALLCEVLLAAPSPPAVGPESTRFRTQPGQLADAAGDLEVVHSFEGEVVDPDGRFAHVARLLAVNH